MEISLHLNPDVKKDLYELQLLGFRAHDVFDYVENTIIEFTTLNTDEVKQTLLKRYPDSRSVIETKSDTFFKEALESVTAHSRELMCAVDDLFAIPPNVLLPEDMLQSTQYTKEEEEKIDREIQQLKDRAKTACFMEEYLEKEAEEIQKVRNVETKFKELEVVCISEADNKVIHILQNLKKIKDLGESVLDTSNIIDDNAIESRFQNL